MHNRNFNHKGETHGCDRWIGLFVRGRSMSRWRFWFILQSGFHPPRHYRVASPVTKHRHAWIPPFLILSLTRSQQNWSCIQITSVSPFLMNAGLLVANHCVYPCFIHYEGNRGADSLKRRRLCLMCFTEKQQITVCSFSCRNTPAEGQFLWRKQENLQCFEKAAGHFARPLLYLTVWKRKYPLLLKNIHYICVCLCL